MKTRTIILFLAMALMSSAYCQRPTMSLTFHAVDNDSYVQLDSIRVMNRTLGGDTVLYYPDTVLTLDYQVGIPEAVNQNEGLQVFQNFPNPVYDQTTISMYIPEKDQVNVFVTDILGRQLFLITQILDKGNHSFRFMPGNAECYFLTA